MGIKSSSTIKEIVTVLENFEEFERKFPNQKPIIIDSEEIIKMNSTKRKHV